MELHQGQKHGDAPKGKASDGPAISVVIPLYNREAMIGPAVESVLGQTFTDFELIVVDDGSTDNGPTIVEGFSDPRVRLIRQDRNRGANAARNEGVRQARGSIIAFLDSDDLFLPNKLSTVSSAFASRPDLGLMMDSFRKIRRNGGETVCRNPRMDDRGELVRALFDRRIWKSTSGISVRREAALGAGMFDEGLKRWQDLDFLLRLVRQVPSASSSDVTWVKTYTNDSISADLTTFMTAFTDFWDRHPDYYDDPVMRDGFSMDLARHAVRLVKRRRWRQLRAELGLVSRRIGSPATMRALAHGGADLLRLRRYRSGLDRLHGAERR